MSGLDPGKYFGEEIVDVSQHSIYSKYTPADWAMLYIERYSGIDGSHHKDWLIDQVARIMKGTKVIVKLAVWERHTEYRFTLDEPPKEYHDWVEEMKGEFIDGEYEYDYDYGIAP